MNLTRLICLGLLAEYGARHGHQLRRDVENAKADEWAGVGAGSVHRELRVLSRAGLIEAVRTEQVGNWPPRTVYQITSAGQEELAGLREQAMADLQETADAMAVGLIFAAPEDPLVLVELLARHRQAVQAELTRLAL